MDKVLLFLAALSEGLTPKTRVTEKDLLDAYGVTTANQLPDGGKFNVEKVFRASSRFPREKIVKAAQYLKRSLELHKRAKLLAIIAAYEPGISIPETELLVTVEKIVKDLRADREKHTQSLFDHIDLLKKELGDPPLLPMKLERMSDEELVSYHDELVAIHEICDHLFSHPHQAVDAAAE